MILHPVVINLLVAEIRKKRLEENQMEIFLRHES